jgi:cytochrome P450
MALFRKPPGKDFLEWMNDIPNDGLLMFYGLGNQPRVLLTNPKALSEVLVQKSYMFKKPRQLRTFLRRILGDGLIIVEGEEHKFQRKHIMPVFGYRHLKELYPMMWKKSVALTQGVQAEMDSNQPSMNEKNKDSNVVEVNHWANKVTMDIIGVAGLGRDFNALKNSDDPLVENYEEILEPTVEKLSFFVCQIILPQWFVNRLPWGLNERVRIITGNLTRICNELVADKRLAIKQHADEHKDILSVLINSNNFSDQQLTDQLLTFLAAGYVHYQSFII